MPATNPAARADASMAYDPGTSQLVLFGGDGLPANFNDTWNYEVVGEVPSITSADSTTFAVGTDGSFQATASGYPTPITWSETGALPSGVTLDGSTGLLSGTPAAGTAGTYPITLRATNSAGTGTQAFTLHVNGQTTSTSLQASSPSATFETPVTLSATVSPSSGPTGTVSFSDTANGQTYHLGTESLASGQAHYVGPLPAVGANALTATYSGDDAYQGSTSNTADVSVTAPFGLLTVTQLRFSGPGGNADSYVDLENTSTTASLPLAGWSLGVDSSSGTADVSLPASVTVPPGGAFLVAGSSYSLDTSPNEVAAPDLTSSALTGTLGVQVDPPSGGGNPTDAVGYPVTGGYYGGSGLPSLFGSPSDQYAFIRGGSQAQPTDTGNNATDFELVSTDAASFPLFGGGSTQSVLGSPSPLSSTSPQQSNATMPSTLLDPSAAASSCPNRTFTTGTPGTLVVNRTITNTTGRPVTALELRLTSLSEQYGPPSGDHAWLRAVSSADPTTTTCGTTPYQTDGLALNAPVGSQGGGLGTTWSPAEVSTSHPLAPGASISVTFEFAVEQSGSFSFGYDVDVTTQGVGDPGRSPLPFSRGFAGDSGRIR